MSQTSNNSQPLPSLILDPSLKPVTDESVVVTEDHLPWPFFIKTTSKHRETLHWFFLFSTHTIERHFSHSQLDLARKISGTAVLHYSPQLHMKWVSAILTAPPIQEEQANIQVCMYRLSQGGRGLDPPVSITSPEHRAAFLQGPWSGQEAISTPHIWHTSVHGK